MLDDPSDESASSDEAGAPANDEEDDSASGGSKPSKPAKDDDADEAGDEPEADDEASDEDAGAAGDPDTGDEGPAQPSEDAAAAAMPDEPGGEANEDASVGSNEGESDDAEVTCGDSVCNDTQVCCSAPFPCAGMCVPDCRLGAQCPNELQCNDATGVCEPPDGEPGDPPMASDGMPPTMSAPEMSAPPPMGEGGAPPTGPGGTMTGPGGTMTGPGGTMTGPGGTMTGPGGTGTGPGGMGGGPNGAGGATGGPGGTSTGGSTPPSECDVPSGDGTVEAAFGKGTMPSADWQGNAAALDCDTLAVGDPAQGGVNPKNGKVHVYNWDGDVWNEQQNIALADADQGTTDMFGTSVAIEGDTMVVGASHKNACNKPDCTGSVGLAYIFTRADGVWTQLKALSSSSQHYMALFGMNVAISGSTIAVAAPWQRIPTTDEDGGISTKNQGGWVEIWTKGPSNWNYSTKITAPGLQSGDYTGTGLALSGTNLVMGAPGNLDGSTARAGRVFVYTGSGSTWTHEITLSADDGIGGDGFGRSVAYASDLVVVGAPNRDATELEPDASAVATDVGAVYVFNGSGADLEQSAVLYPPSPVIDAKFGFTVATPSSTRIVVGAPGLNTVYVYDLDGDVWSLTATHTACADNGGGGSLAASGDVAFTASDTETRSSWVIDLADPDTSCIE